MTVTYTKVNGRILSENRGGVVHHFISDPQGNVVMVRDTAGNTVYAAEYDPYGNVQSESGSNPSDLGYVGVLGYVTDAPSDIYVGARYLRPDLGRWLTKDPLWPNEPGFVYADAAPTLVVDPTGMAPGKIIPGESHYNCRQAKRCHDHPRPKPAECNGFPPIGNRNILCNKVATIETKCCMDLDGDGFTHWVLVLWDVYICYLDVCYENPGMGVTWQFPKGLRTSTPKKRCIKNY